MSLPLHPEPSSPPPSKSLPFADGGEIAIVQLTEWLDWVTKNKPEVLVALPIIQRGSVWSASEVTTLWDSLLRGMPVGCMTVSRNETAGRETIRDIRDIRNNRAREDQEIPAGSLSLLDGQQRTLAMCIGWPWKEEMDRWIWVDFGNPGISGQTFCLRVTSRFHPFGFSPSDHKRKLARWERRTARGTFNQDPQHAHLLKEPDFRLPLSKTRPYGAALPLGLHTLIRDWRDLGQDAVAWVAKTLHRLSPDGLVPEPVVARVHALASALHRLFTKQIALVRVAPEIVADHPDDAEPALVVLFNRIANAGVPLSNADYVFSLIKHQFPEAHNLVQDLHQAESVASLLSANEVVMTAVRLAANTHLLANGEYLPDIPIPNPREFGRMLKAKVGEPETDFLKGALMPLIHRESPFALHHAFTETQRLLEYRGEVNPLDPGLPKLAFPLLQRHLVQVLVFWIHQRQRAIESPELRRQQFNAARPEILRFVLFWLVCVANTEKNKEAAGKSAFEFLRSGEHVVFPGKALADLLCKKHLAVALEHPATLAKSIFSVPAPGAKIRRWHTRFWTKVAENYFETQPLYSRWFHRKELLLWLQRKTLPAIFKDANPLAGRDEETPYDYDHICPDGHWHTDYRSRGTPFKEFCEGNDSWTIGSSLGNFRVWDSSSNRSDQDDSPAIKLQLANLQNADTLRLLEQSLIEVSEAANWAAISGGEDAANWTEARAWGFQAVVEARAFRLFERYFHEADFGEWISPAIPHQLGLLEGQLRTSAVLG